MVLSFRMIDRGMTDSGFLLRNYSQGVICESFVRFRVCLTSFVLKG